MNADMEQGPAQQLPVQGASSRRRKAVFISKMIAKGLKKDRIGHPQKQAQVQRQVHDSVEQKEHFDAHGKAPHLR
jgi:hypothetical protein